MVLLLTDDNFIATAMKHYDKPTCSIDEFNEDLNRFKVLQRCLSTYRIDGNINEHLVLNHIITLFNLFGDITVDMLLFKIKKENWCILRPFLILINRDHKLLEETQIDLTITTKLRELVK